MAQRWWPLIVAVISLLVIALRPSEDQLNLFFMRFFRNLGRAKARARRMENANAVVIASISLEMMLGYDDPADGIDYDAEQEEGESFTFSSEELAEFGNGDAGKPLLLSIFGRIYDVSAGERFYGVGEKYHIFVAKDATRSFCTGCLRPECLISSTIGLSDEQVREGRRWLEFFQLHDKYAFVGRLEEKQPVDLDEIVAKAISAEQGSADKKALEDLREARENQT